MIEIKEVRKSFGDKEVLRGVSTVMEPGKANLVIGKSGSGKTVFLKCMVGLFEVTSGSVVYDGRDFSRMSKKERTKIRTEIGMLFQGGALFDSMTVEENIMFPLNMFTNMTSGEKQKRVDFCLDRVDLKGVNDRYPSETSGGMQKRIGIARAIVLNPKYLFCDEPNSGLDPRTSILIDELLSDITKEYKMTTIINTHDMNSVMEMGDKVIFLHFGEKEWEGTNKEILNSGNDELNDFIFASKFLKELRKGVQGSYGKDLAGG